MDIGKRWGEMRGGYRKKCGKMRDGYRKKMGRDGEWVWEKNRKIEKEWKAG